MSWNDVVCGACTAVVRADGGTGDGVRGASCRTLQCGSTGQTALKSRRLGAGGWREDGCPGARRGTHLPATHLRRNASPRPAPAGPPPNPCPPPPCALCESSPLHYPCPSRILALSPPTHPPTGVAYGPCLQPRRTLTHPTAPPACGPSCRERHAGTAPSARTQRHSSSSSSIAARFHVCVCKQTGSRV